MWFGSKPVSDGNALAGAILAHSLRLGDGRRLKKGIRLEPDDLAALRASDITDITVAIPDADDLSEDEAAARIADAVPLVGMRREDVGTGRVNLHATADGVLTITAERIDAMNRIDPAVTVATLPAWTMVQAGQMVATVKIIPFAVSSQVAERAAAALSGADTIRVHAFRKGLSSAIIQTRVQGTKDSVLDKTLRITAARLEELHASVGGETRVAHEEDALAAEIRRAAAEADIILVFGASAVTDPRDVIPAAIESAGGSLIHVGMPVDPGNLLVLGEFEGKPVIGAPGCARSPKENGFDWVLRRLCAGIAVTSDDIFAMGVGGLLTEIPIRPHPRERRAGTS